MHEARVKDLMVSNDSVVFSYVHRYGSGFLTLNLHYAGMDRTLFMYGMI